MKPQSRPLLLVSPTLKNVTEGDCACALPSEIPPSGASFQGQLRMTPGLISQRLNNEFHVFLSPQGRRGASVLNREAVKALNAFHSPTICVYNCVKSSHVVNDQSNLLRNFVFQGLVTAEAPMASDTSSPRFEVLTAWLHLTDRCNLQCSYCYLPHVQEDMTLETGKAAIDSVFWSAAKHDFKRVKLKYAGGEPLIRFPLIVELHTYASHLAKQGGFVLEGIVLSNGTLLTDAMAESLRSLDIQLMISLDGLGNYHDSHRHYASGRGSFKTVSVSIERALVNGILPNISITVSSRTIDGLPGLMQWILERGLAFDLNFYRENDFSLHQLDMALDEEKIIQGMLAAFIVVEANLPRRNLLAGMIDRVNMNLSHEYVCGVGQNYLVFDQNGQVAKCQMLMHKPVGNIHEDDLLLAVNSDRMGVQNIPVREKSACQHCEWRHWCAGGCPLETYRVSGRYDVKSPNCNIYQTLFPEALRLEGLRILKYGNELML